MYAHKAEIFLQKNKQSNEHCLTDLLLLGLLILVPQLKVVGSISTQDISLWDEHYDLFWVWQQFI